MLGCGSIIDLICKDSIPVSFLCCVYNRVGHRFLIQASRVFACIQKQVTPSGAILKHKICIIERYQKNFVIVHAYFKFSVSITVVGILDQIGRVLGIISIHGTRCRKVPILKLIIGNATQILFIII